MPKSTSRSTVSRSGVLEAIGFLFRQVRPAERILVGILALGLVLIVVSRTGETNFRTVWIQYFRFFARNVAIVFIISRVAYWIDENYVPPGAALKRVKIWILGEKTEGRLGHHWLDTLMFVNRKRLGARPSVLGNDLEFIRNVMILLGSLAMYSNIKTRIPFIRDRTLGDKFFKDLDGMLIPEGWIETVEHWFASSSDVTAYFQHVYMHDYTWMVLLMVLLYIRRDTFSLKWLVLSVSITYVVAIMITAVYPSVGPVYMDPEHFGWLKGTRMHSTQQHLLRYFIWSTGQMEAGEGITAKAFVGIAAFPSLHVGHMMIIFWIALRTVPIYSIWMVWTSALTVLATIGFGWHYAVDAVGGAVLAIVVSESLYRFLRRHEPAAAPHVIAESTD